MVAGCLGMLAATDPLGRIELGTEAELEPEALVDWRLVPA